MNAPEYVKASVLARRLGVSLRTVRRWEVKGALPAAARPGGRLKLFDLARVEEALQAGKVVETK